MLSVLSLFVASYLIFVTIQIFSKSLEVIMQFAPSSPKVPELVEFITMDSNDQTELCLDTIEEHIFCHGDVHPNVERIFKRIHDSERASWNPDMRSRLSKRQHDEFSQSQIELAIRTLLVTMAIDPRSRRKQRKLFKQLKERCENNDIKPYEITHSILNGKPLPTWNS